MRRMFFLLALISSTAHANQLQSQNTNTQSVSAPSSANATTGSQVVTVVVPPSKPVVIVLHKTVHHTKIKKVTKVVEVITPNRLQVLLGVSRTKQQISESSCGCTLTATRVYQPDVGLQYLRDFGSFTGSLTATQNQALYVGVGFNW